MRVVRWLILVSLALLVGRYLYRFAMTEYHWHQGNAAYRQKSYQEAARSYSLAVDYGKTCPGVHMACLYCDRGDALDLNGQLNEALADYQEAIRLEPQESRFRYERAIAYRRAKRYQEAVAEMDAAIGLASGRPNYYYERAVSLVALEEYRRAVADLDQYRSLAELDTSLAAGRQYRSYDLRGWAHFKLGENQQALADYNEALKINPTYAQALHDRAEVEMALGMKEAAESDYQQAEKAGMKR